MYINIDCVSESLCKSFEGGSKLWQPSTCSTIAFLKCLFQAENSMTGRAYMGEVLS